MAKKLKVLSFFLIFSGALNVALMAALVYFSSEKSSSLEREKKYLMCAQKELFDQFQSSKFRELVSVLTNREKIEGLYTKRDLALGALVAYHHFDLQRALSEEISPTHTLFGDQKKSVPLFLGLLEDQFDAIVRFAYQEKWPLTPKGLFLALKQGGQEETLRQAFFLTPQFRWLEDLFQRTKAPRAKEELLSLTLEGGWDVLQSFYQAYPEKEGFSSDKRRAFLLAYLSSGSSHAAYFLLKSDFLFALHELTEAQTLEILNALKTPSEEGVQFALELLKQERGDAIWSAAANNLYAYEGRSAPLPIDPKEVFLQFSSHKKKVSEPLLKKGEAPLFRYHTVKEGESLWKISRQYGVKVDEIVKINDLESSSLFPGMTLKVP